MALKWLLSKRNILQSLFLRRSLKYCFTEHRVDDAAEWCCVHTYSNFQWQSDVQRELPFSADMSNSDRWCRCESVWQIWELYANVERQPIGVKRRPYVICDKEQALLPLHLGWHDAYMHWWVLYTNGKSLSTVFHFSGKNTDLLSSGLHYPLGNVITMATIIKNTYNNFRVQCMAT